MTDTASVPSAIQNPCTTADTTTGSHTSTDSNVMYYGHGESGVEPTTTFEHTADDLSVEWERQMAEPQQKYQQQYHISQRQNHLAQAQPSHHGIAIQDLGYPDYSSTNAYTCQPPGSMNGALNVQRSGHHVIDGHLFQASYHDPTTSVVDDEGPYIARLPGPGWTRSTEAQRVARKRPGLDSIDGSDPSSGFDYNYQDSPSGRSLPDSENTGHKSGDHAQAPAEYHSSMARGTKSGTWTRSEKDCLDAVLLLDDRTKYHRIGSAMKKSGYPPRSRKGYDRLIGQSSKE